MLLNKELAQVDDCVDCTANDYQDLEGDHHHEAAA